LRFERCWNRVSHCGSALLVARMRLPMAGSSRPSGARWAAMLGTFETTLPCMRKVFIEADRISRISMPSASR